MRKIDTRSLSRKPSNFVISSRLTALLSGTALIITSIHSPSIAEQLPQGANVKNGSVNISRNGNNMTVTQGSNKAIVNWNSFSVGAQNGVKFVQPDSSSAILNRVTGTNSSKIAGSITGNGQVYLVNPNGIAITPSGNVRVDSGFIASTLDISDQDFLNNKARFTGNGASASVRNEGIISVGRGGYAALLGGKVRNDGLIAVPYGKIGLGSGEQAVLDFSGDGFLQVAIPTAKGAEGKEALIEQRGKISAESGTVVLQSATARQAARHAINLSGVVEATSVSGKNGSITIGGGLGGNVKLSGKVSSKSTAGKGGNITVTGKSVQLAKANIDASGSKGGGTVKIGGDWQGKGPTQRAETLNVDAESIIRSDATTSGDGGTVVLWSDEKTQFDGLITARGGANAGNGGDVEVSGKALLGFTGFVDLTAKNGVFGSLLLDPYNVTISTAANKNSNGFTASGLNSIINVTALRTQLNSANVTVSTGSANSPGNQTGHIYVNSPLSWTSATTLTLRAAGNIYFNSPVTSQTAGAGLKIEYGTGKDYYVYQPITLSGAGSKLWIGATGATQEYTLLRSMDDIESINDDLAGNYALARSITSTKTYRESVVGPSGYNSKTPSNNLPSNYFTGSFTGLGNTITNFEIRTSTATLSDQPAQMYGLFGFSSGTVRDIGLKNGGIFTDHTSKDYDYIYFNIGHLVGHNYGGTIHNAFSTGQVEVTNVVLPGDHNNSTKTIVINAGGLAGMNESIVSNNSLLKTAVLNNVFAEGGVSIDNISGWHDVIANAGGLVGVNQGEITNAYAKGDVTISKIIGYATRYLTKDTDTIPQGPYTYASVDAQAGGLAGINAFTIKKAYATGHVSATDISAEVLGNDEVIDEQWWLDTVYSGSFHKFQVDARAKVGGLIGTQSATTYGPTPFIENTYTTIGTVTVDNVRSHFSTYNILGGLIGFMQHGQIRKSFAANTVALTNTDVTSPIRGTADDTVKNYRGGLTGYADAVYSRTIDSYYNIEAFGEQAPYAPASYDGNVLGQEHWHTIEELKTRSTYDENSWDFVNVWAPAGEGYLPELYALSRVLRVSVDDHTRAYGTESEFTVNYIGGHHQYAFGSNDALLPNTTFVTPKGTIESDVGEYDIDIEQFASDWNGDEYRFIREPAQAKLTITKAPLTITPNTLSRTYGSANPTLTYTVNAAQLRNNDTQANMTWTGALATTATSASNVGSYAINIGNLDTGNYAITLATRNLSVTKAPLTITPSALSRTYGSANPTLTYTANAAQLLNGDTQANMTWTGALATTATSTSNVGAYAINKGDLATTNYELTLASQNLQITKAALTVVANQQSHAYGLSMADLTYQISSGQLFNGDKFTGVLGTSSGTKPNAGSHQTTQGSLSAGSNYTLNFVGSTLTVNKAALTITANDVIKFANGLPLLTVNGVSYSGFAYGETTATLSGTLTYGGTAFGAESPGTYSINVSGLYSANYDISYIDGSATIHPALEHVTPPPATSPIVAPVIFTGTTAKHNDFILPDITRLYAAAEDAESSDVASAASAQCSVHVEQDRFRGPDDNAANAQQFNQNNCSNADGSSGCCSSN